MILWLVSSFFLLFSPRVIAAGDSVCYGYTSATSYFSCGAHGNCTWWAAYKRPDLSAKICCGGWDAKYWYEKAQALGFPVGSVPKAGAIVVFDATANNSAGHVAYVEYVHPDDSFDVSEMDWFKSPGFVDGVNYATYYPNGDGTYHRNTGSSVWTPKGFVYYKASCDPSKERCGLRTSGSIGWYPPVQFCDQASQWFRLIQDNEEKVSRIEPTTKDQCPTACYAN